VCVCVCAYVYIYVCVLCTCVCVCVYMCLCEDRDLKTFHSLFSLPPPSLPLHIKRGERRTSFSMPSAICTILGVAVLVADVGSGEETKTCTAKKRVNTRHRAAAPRLRPIGRG